MPLTNFMEIMCEVCGQRAKTRVRWCKYVCDFCEPEKVLAPQTVETRYLPSYGHVSLKRIDEMKRRRILPKPSTETNRDYYVGRMGENGKIEEREPNY